MKGFRLPFLNVSADVRNAPFHDFDPFMRHCVDYAMPVGTPVVAVRAGVVSLVLDGHPETQEDPKNADLCNVVEIRHGKELSSVYAHLDEILVCTGQKVAAGDVIGKSGQSGFATYPHLHFGLYKNGESVRFEGR